MLSRWLEEAGGASGSCDNGGGGDHLGQIMMR